MIKQFVIGTVEQETLNYMQAIDYDNMRYSQIIRAVLAENPKLDTETFALYKAEYAEVFAKQQMVRETFEKDFVLAKLVPGTRLVRWYIDPDTCNVHVVAEVPNED